MARITQNGEKNAFIFIVVPLLRIADGSEFVRGFLLRLRPATLLKKRLWHKCFSVNFVKFLRIPFLRNTDRRLLLLHFLSVVGVFYTAYRSL